MSVSHWVRAGGFASCLFLAGCGGGGPLLVPVEGVVKINGKPAGNIAVQFQPDVMKGGKGPTSFGSTNGDGKFRLRTHDGRVGAVVGPHVVLLHDEIEDRPPQGGRAPKPARLSPQFGLAASALKQEVTAGGPPVVLEVAGPR